MDFSFTEEQEMLRKIARDFLSTECPKDLVRKMVKDEKGYTPELWGKMAELGWMGLIIPEKYGGIEGSFLDIAVLLEEMGRAALPGPFFPTLIGSLAILELGSAEQKNELLPKIAQGKLVLTLAISEPDVGYELTALQCQVTAEGKEYTVDGTKLFVEYAHIANLMLCAARSKGSAGQQGITLFLIDAKDPNLTLTPLETIAGDKQFEVRLKRIRVPQSGILGEAHKGGEYLQKLLQVATVAKCAEMVGGAQQVLDMTVDYAKQRVQFDHPIGSLQAIQHHCANMLIDLEGMKYVTYVAAWKVSEGMPCSWEVAVAKAWASQACPRVIALAHQIHGAIGTTMDHDLHYYTRRTKAAESAFGDADFYQWQAVEAISS